MPAFPQQFYGYSTDGENWIASVPMEFFALGRHFRVAAGATTDGPSVPHWLGSVVRRTGPQWLPAVCHDAGYRDDLEEALNDAGGDTWSWHHVTLPKDQCDLIFRELLLANGTKSSEADLFYLAVKDLGSKAFNQDRGN